MTAAYDDALRPVDLRVTQFAVLRLLDRHGPMAVTRLAAEAALERSTMGRNLDPLERRGLVSVAVGEADGRVRVARLTDAGSAALAAALPYWMAAQEQVAAHVAPATVADLASRLSRLGPA